MSQLAQGICGACVLLMVIGLYLLHKATWGREQRASELLTPQLLQDCLQSRYPGLVVRTVNVLHVARCGDGKASTTDRILIELTSEAPPSSALPPQRMMVKTILLPRYLRLGSSLPLIQLGGGLARMLRPIGLDKLVCNAINVYNFYLPQGIDAMYRNESMFYRRLLLSGELVNVIEAPEVFGVIMDERNCQYGVIVEDLTLRGAIFPTALDHLPLAHCRGVLEVLARLHATFWDSPRLHKDLTWLPTPHTGGMQAVFDAIGFGLIEDHVRSNQFEQKLIEPLGLSVEQLWAGLERAQEVLATPPLTVCHGDTHVGNTFSCNGKPGLYDFQLSLRAKWSRDVSYIMGTCLSTAQRREHEHKLLEYYLKMLCAAGVKNPPSFVEAWDDYRQAMAWGLVIGWLICPPNNYGPAILSANVSKLVAACKDLNTFEALGIISSS